MLGKKIQSALVGKVCLSLGIVIAVYLGFLWHNHIPSSYSSWGVSKTIVEGEKSFPGYVGPESCPDCHQTQYDLWYRSGHGFAERLIQPAADRAAFNPARSFKHASQTSRAHIQNGQYQIVTLGFRTNVESYQVERVIGYEPLRQFLTPAPGGRWQVHEAAYDPKSNQWFNVYGTEDRQPGEYGHWTGRGMNWNSRCASCHNTRLRKNYDETADSYHTTMAEMGVGCEACHGPLRAHVEWRKAHPNSKGPESAPPVVKRSQTMDVCGACHSRRDELTGDFKPGDSFFDHFSLEILDGAGRWYPDGQVRDEDYEFASFLSSRMVQSGVHCRDCHRTDSGTGNALCMRCHQGKHPGFAKAPVIDPAEHGHHKLNDKGGECIACHMPVTVYMQRHRRHDHGFTIPDPLLTKELAIPNACNRCHADESVDWAVAYTERWYGSRMNRPTRERARWIAAAIKGEESAKDHLLAMLTLPSTLAPRPSTPVPLPRQSETTAGPYWRAVAANLLWRWADDAKVKAALLAHLKDEHPLVREKAVGALEPLVQSGDPEAMTALNAMLDDPMRCVRVAAAWVLRARLDLQSRAGRDLQLALSQEADQPLGQYRQAMFQLSRQQPAEALAHLQKAIAWDPFSPPFRCMSAVVLNQLGRTAEALDALTEAEKLAPQDPQIPYARAMNLARSGRLQEARAAADRALAIEGDFQPARELLEQIPASR